MTKFALLKFKLERTAQNLSDNLYWAKSERPGCPGSPIVSESGRVALRPSFFRRSFAPIARGKLDECVGADPTGREQVPTTLVDRFLRSPSGHHCAPARQADDYDGEIAALGGADIPVTHFTDDAMLRSYLYKRANVMRNPEC